MPATTKSKREILFIYGSHASLERIVGVCENVAADGNVTAPDLPGFGGMTSLYHLPRRAFTPRPCASFDELADYLAWFIRKNYDPKTKIDLIGMSMGFAITTRMLQRHPDLVPQIRHLISYVGFANYHDFKMKNWQRRTFIELTWLVEHRPLAWLMRHTWCTRPVLKFFYSLNKNKNEKFIDTDFNDTLNMEIKLWQINDVRTHVRTINEMLRLDDPRSVNLPVYHIAMADDRYFDNTQTEKSLTQIYNKVHVINSRANNHAPSVIATADEATDFIPDELHDLLK